MLGCRTIIAGRFAAGSQDAAAGRMQDGMCGHEIPSSYGPLAATPPSIVPSATRTMRNAREWICAARSKRAPEPWMESRTGRGPAIRALSSEAHELTWMGCPLTGRGGRASLRTSRRKRERRRSRPTARRRAQGLSRSSSRVRLAQTTWCHRWDLRPRHCASSAARGVGGLLREPAKIRSGRHQALAQIRIDEQVCFGHRRSAVLVSMPAVVWDPCRK